MKNKNDKIVLIIIISTIIVLGWLIFFNIKKNTKVEVNATVKETGNNYIIVVDENDEEYLLETKKNYSIDDKLNIILKNVKKGSRITGEIVDINKISKEVVFSITDDPASETTTTNEFDNSTTKNNSNVNDKNNNIDAVKFINDLSNEVESSNKLESSIKDKFVVLVDFIFYDGKIKDKTFKELSTSTKLKVLELFLKLDNKIENKYPNYKNNISPKGNKVYNNVKNKALNKYFEITTEACENDEDLCNSAKEGLRNMKESFSLTWDIIKEVTGAGITKLKNWYEIWRDI